MPKNLDNQDMATEIWTNTEAQENHMLHVRS